MGAFPTKTSGSVLTEHVDGLSGEKLNELIESRGGEENLESPACLDA
jgi:hypothetical protein